jgi:hypothetical protein
MQKCRWTYTEIAYGEDFIYETSCGKAQFFSTGDVIDNEYKYCPWCGGKIEVVE